MTPINVPQDNTPMLMPNGTPTITWYQFFTGVLSRLGGNPGLIPLAGYTVAGLPPASKYPSALVYVTNSGSGKTLAVSNGTNWIWGDGGVVS